MSDMPPAKRTNVNWAIGFLLSLVLLLSVALVGFAGFVIWESTRTKGSTATSPPGSVDAQAQAIEAKLKDLEKKADHLQVLISVLLGLATFYSAALGVASYLGIQHAVHQAEKSASDIEEMSKDIRKEFPIFRYISGAIDEIVKLVKRELPLLDWTEVSYGGLRPEVRSMILFYEKTVASLECFDMGTYRKEMSQIHQGLGNFYALKYLHGGRLAKDDLALSLFYLDRAVKEDPQNVGALNDRGHLAATAQEPPDFSLAKSDFEKSLAIDGEQQRGHYNLAVVEHSTKNYQRSVELLTKALGLKRWQETPSPRHRVHMLYNRACGYARLAGREAAQKEILLGRALTDLREALKRLEDWNIEELKAAVRSDLGEQGDLYILKTTDPFSKELKAVLDAGSLSEEW